MVPGESLAVLTLTIRSVPKIPDSVAMTGRRRPSRRTWRSGQNEIRETLLNPV